jgi:hypothetical protein
MLRAVPKYWFSSDFIVKDSTSKSVGEVRLSSWRERGAVKIGEMEYAVARQGILGDYVFERQGSILARAEKPNALRNMFIMKHDGKQYVLKRRSFMFRELVLYEGEHEAGRITPEGPFTRRALVQLPEQLPLAMKLFIICLAMLLWRRDQHSSASNGTT